MTTWRKVEAMRAALADENLDEVTDPTELAPLARVLNDAVEDGVEESAAA